MNNMKWPLGKLFYVTGRFFFWLSLIMILLFIAESLIFPNIETFTYKEANDFKLKGGCYTYSGDMGMEIRCGGGVLGKRTPIEYFLNIPSYYIIVALFLPLATLDTLLVDSSLPGRQVTSLNRVILLISLSLVWLLIVISMGYFFYKKCYQYYLKAQK